jgi:hypothetical protein
MYKSTAINETIMTTQTFSTQNNTALFYTVLSYRIQEGFKIIEQNDKLPYVVLTKETQAINHKLHFLLTCVTLGLWATIWIYLIIKASKNKKILVAIDEDGKIFEEKCLSE